jgi:hypothetical protein
MKLLKLRQHIAVINLMNFFVMSVFLTTIGVLLMGAFKGQTGDPIAFQHSYQTGVGTPFEGTNSTSRYALTQAIVDNGRFYFDQTQARFSSPDTSFYNGKYFSLFTPGVSFLAAPLYFVGKVVGLPQFFTFLTNIIFALINVYLVYKVTRKLGVNMYLAMLSGLLFLFGSNALAYSLTLTQHHIASAIILTAVLLAMERVSILNNLLFGALFGFGLLVDIPVGFLMMPLGFYFLYKNFEKIETENRIVIKIKYAIVALLIGTLPLIAIFGWYNYQLTGSYTKLAQLIGRVDVPDNNPDVQNTLRPKEEVPGPKEFKVFETPFNTRNSLDGFYVLLISDERGWYYFSPVLILATIGMVLAIQKQATRRLGVLLGTVGTGTLLLYSMFGDPYGGWSFGPRYMIPATAVMSPGIGVFLQRWGKNIWAGIIFFGFAGYSVWLSTIGAMTTSAIPPKQESMYLTSPIPYTYQYNLDFIEKNFSSSLVYNLVFTNFMNVTNYIYMYVTIIMLISVGLYLNFRYSESREGKNNSIFPAFLRRSGLFNLSGIKLPGFKVLRLNVVEDRLGLCKMGLHLFPCKNFQICSFAKPQILVCQIEAGWITFCNKGFFKLEVQPV